MGTSLEAITINGIDYVPTSEMVSPVPMREIRIIVADRGWVFVGECVDNPDGTVTIHAANNIRSWGTTKGLGELINGPIPNKTKFDFYGDVKCTPIVSINVLSGW